MELLQKLTLYDLLGYALPGSIVLILQKWDKIIVNNLPGEKLDVGKWALLIIFGYLLGIVIAEMMHIIVSKICPKVYWQDICEKRGITNAMVLEALRTAKMIESTCELSTNDEFQVYIDQIYACVQTDSRYIRIHNYASAELLYRNMIFVSVYCVGISLIRHMFLGVAIGVLGTFCFGKRWSRFQKKKVGYAICWFLDKYCRHEEGVMVRNDK